MNTLIHITLNFFIIEAIFGNAREFILVILIFSTFVDIDHFLFLFKFGWNYFLKKGFTAESKTRYHGLYGLFVYSLALSIIYFFYPNKIIIEIAIVCLILHFILDFLTSRNKPLLPYSKAEQFLGSVPDKHRVKAEIITTIVLGGLFWLYLLI
jgi:hypothetical protein